MPEPQDTIVTLAVLSTKLDHVLEALATFGKRFDRVCEAGDRRGERIATLDSAQALTRQWQGEHEKRHDRENVVLKTWSVVSATIAATVGSVVAWVRG